MMVLRSSMKGEDNMANGKCHVFTFKYARERYAWAYLLMQVSYVYISINF
jgi:hypothetical protein